MRKIMASAALAGILLGAPSVFAQKVHVMSACKQHNCSSERIAATHNTEMR